MCVFFLFILLYFFWITGRLDNDENEDEEGKKIEEKFHEGMDGDYTRRNPSLNFFESLSLLTVCSHQIFFFILTQKTNP